MAINVSLKESSLVEASMSNRILTGLLLLLLITSLFSPFAGLAILMGVLFLAALSWSVISLFQPSPPSRDRS